jgi:DNA-binding MarR family transcriptional regulator
LPRYAIPVTDSSLPAGLAKLPEELVGSSTFLLKRLGFTAREQAIEAYARSGLHPYHHAVLALLDEGSRETQGAIADALGYDRGQLVGLLDELEQRGLIARRRDPADRRRHTVHLTPSGKATLADLRSLASGIEDDFLAPLDDTQRAQLHAILLRLAGRHVARSAAPAPLPDGAGST